jgi:transcriptional regulator GlxA family with amidase domain
VRRRRPGRALAPADLRPLRGVCELFDFLEEVVFWVKDREGRYCWANTANLLALGLHRREDIEGKTDSDFMPAHIAAQFRADDALVLAGQRIVKRIELIGRADHTARWSVTFKLPLEDTRGRVVGTVGITRPMKSETWHGLPLGEVIAFISDHYRESLDNGQLAKVAGLSERTFERRFRRHYGSSPRQYIKRVRVRMACHALVYTDQPIARVAAEHGFADQSYFTREFRDVIGQTPRDYRRSFQGRRT